MGKPAVKVFLNNYFTDDERRTLYNELRETFDLTEVPRPSGVGGGALSNAIDIIGLAVSLGQIALWFIQARDKVLARPGASHGTHQQTMWPETGAFQLNVEDGNRRVTVSVPADADPRMFDSVDHAVATAFRQSSSTATYLDFENGTWYKITLPDKNRSELDG